MSNALSRSAFDAFHPATSLVYVTGLVVCGLLLDNPLFQAIGLAGAVTMLAVTEGTAGLRSHTYVIVLFILVTLLNPLFSTTGSTVLFRMPWGRPFTAEALAFGAIMASMLAQALLWFAVFHGTGGSERISYVLSRRAPALALVLTMALALIPRYRRKAQDAAMARKGIGLDGDGSLRGRVASAGAVLSYLSGWAFESSVTTADSMRSRGYGTGKRTSYRLHRFGARDALAFLFMAAVLSVLMVAGAVGALDTVYFPTIALPPASPWLLAAALLYAAFVFAPTALVAKEAALWRFSISAM